MPSQKRIVPYELLIEFGRGRIKEYTRGRMVGMREKKLSYREIRALTRRNAAKVMRVWKKRAKKYRTNQNAGNKARNETSPQDDRHLIATAFSHAFNHDYKWVIVPLHDSLKSAGSWKIIPLTLNRLLERDIFFEREFPPWFFGLSPSLLSFKIALKRFPYKR